jgi:hypothetical protein
MLLRNQDTTELMGGIANALDGLRYFLGQYNYIFSHKKIFKWYGT